jgi:4-amino-4-deoxy-L-arabinose transferase-like glycosyltransferase
VKDHFSAPIAKKAALYGVIVCIAIIAGASCYLFLYHLGREPFQDYDEATYAEITTESLSYHEFGTFTFLNNLYFNKPPVLFWLMDVSKSVIPDPEAGARFPSAFSGILTLIAVGILVYAATKNWYAAVLGAAILLTTSAFIEPARQARFDILVSLFIMLSTYAFYRAIQGGVGDRKWYLWFGAFMGLTVLTKGPLVIYAGAAVFGILLIYRRFTWLKDNYFWGGIAIALAIILPWHIYETVLYGSTFWDTYLFGQVIDRVQENLFTVGPTNLQYLQYIFEFASPWIYVFCASLAVTPHFWKKISLQEQAALAAAFFGIASVLLVCFVTKTKAFSYLIPLYPFMAVYSAVILYQFSKTNTERSRIILAVVCIALLVNGFTASVYNGFHINTYFSAEVSLAQQEKNIGDLLKADSAPTFYTYNTTTLGSIMYYSRLLQPTFLKTSDEIPENSYVLYQTNQLAKLKSILPTEKIDQLYIGQTLSLAKVI